MELRQKIKAWFAALGVVLAMMAFSGLMGVDPAWWIVSYGVFNHFWPASQEKADKRGE